MRFLNRTIIATLAVALTVSPIAATAAEFDPQHIISDREMRDATTMGLTAIRDFLASKGGLSDQFDIDAIDGTLKNAPQLIYDASQRYQVNPRYILALIQKESSIVETGRPSQRQLDWAAGYALCDGCDRNAALPRKYKGLAKQIDAGAGWMDWYLKKADSGQLAVSSKNLATAALYSYTPHAHGNRLLWSIMQRWFGDGASDLNIPDGALVRNTSNGAVAVIEGGKLRPILNRSVLMTRFNTTNIIDLNKYDFATLQDRSAGAPVRFSDLSLVRTEDGSTYLLVGDTKRRIPTADVFRKIGFNPEEVEDVQSSDLAEYVNGDPISADVSFPLGKLLQNMRTGAVYFVEDGVKHPLLDRAILDANYSGDQISPVTSDALASMSTGDSIRFAEGTLVKTKTDAAVYLISGGKKRSFPSEKVFRAFGYDFKNVLTTSPRALALHELGEPLALSPQK